MPHIISASYRTDIPALYPEWFVHRLAAGYCVVPRPFGGPPERVSLAPEDVAGFVFWTRNVGPFLPVLDHLRKQDRPFVVQFTITALPRAFEAHTLDPQAAAAQLRDLAGRFGSGVAVWRYDPVVLSSQTPPAFHRETFARLAGTLAGAVDEVVVSVAHPYAKTMRRLTEAGVGLDEMRPGHQQQLLRELAAAAAGHGMRLTLCTQPILVAEDLPAARCIDAERLSRVAGRAIRAPVKGNRPGCLCHAAFDIGVYDSCVQGCQYCYAVSSQETAADHRRAHDPTAETL